MTSLNSFTGASSFGFNFNTPQTSTGGAGGFNFNSSKTTTAPSTTGGLFNLGNTATTSGIGGQTGSTNFFGKTGASGSSAPTGGMPTIPGEPPITTVGSGFTPLKMQVQSQNNTTNECNVMSMFAQDRFKGYTPLELRVYDYIKLNKADKLKENPPQPPQQSLASSGFSGTFSFSNNQQNAGQQNKTFNTNISFQVQSNQDAITDDMLNKAVFPDTLPAKIQSAAEFFKPDVQQLKKSRKTDVSIKHDDAPHFVDYTPLFTPRSSLRTKSIAKHIVVDASQLKCAKPMEESTREFIPLQADDVEDFKFKTSPPIKKITNPYKVHSFRIIREGVGTIDFLTPVDISNINFKKDIIINPGFVDIYRIKKIIPQVGKGVNTKATIFLSNIWPKNPSNGIREIPTKQEDMAQYEADLKSFCDFKHAHFDHYKPIEGIFQFTVDNFSSGPFDIP